MKKQAKYTGRSIALLSVAASLILTGCATTQTGAYNQGGQPIYSQPAYGQNQGVSTAVGAVVGGAVGNIIGKDSKSTLIGAAIGGVLGHQYGEYIKQALFGLQQNGVIVDNPQAINNQPGANPNSQPVRITLPEYVTFASGSTILKNDPNTISALNRVAETLNNPQYRYSKIDIIGHSDSSGDPARNQQFSVIRANEVSNYMASRGVDRNRMYAKGMSSAQPIADNSTVEGRARNRRVEIIVYPA